MLEDSEIEPKPFLIFNDRNFKINGDYYLPILDNEKLKSSAVFILHGFKGYKDWGFFPHISETLSKNGFISIPFNFSLNGRVNDKNQLNIDEFASNTISQEINDLKSTIESFINGNIIPNNHLEEIWNGDIYLLGHSLGAAVALLSFKDVKLIKKIVLLAPISRVDRYTDRQKELWKNNGKLEFFDTKLNLELKLNYSFLEDIEKNKFILKDILETLPLPTLLIHGKQDLTANIKEALNIIDWASNSKNLSQYLIDNTGHTFGVENPFTGSTKALDNVIDESLKFFKNEL